MFLQFVIPLFCFPLGGATGREKVEGITRSNASSNTSSGLFGLCSNGLFGLCSRGVSRSTEPESAWELLHRERSESSLVVGHIFCRGAFPFILSRINVFHRTMIFDVVLNVLLCEKYM
jgi:hypothetical protein